jgi:hypothetical protein
VQNELLLKIIEAARTLEIEFAVPITETVPPNYQQPGTSQARSDGVRSSRVTV